MLTIVVARQSVVESVIITFTGDEDVGSELQSRRAVERPGCDKDLLRAVVLREETAATDVAEAATPARRGAVPAEAALLGQAEVRKARSGCVN